MVRVVVGEVEVDKGNMKGGLAREVRRRHEGC